MKPIIYISILIFSFGCFSSQGIKKNKFNGTWIPNHEELGGKILPESYYAKQKLIISDSNYTVMAESIDKGIVQVGDGTMDIYGKEGVNAGKHFSCIYKLEHGELTVCYNLLGDHYPKEFSTQGKRFYFLSVFKKSNP